MTDMPRGLFAYPWDVTDEGADAVLDAVERAGLNALYITTWYHSGMFFLPHNPRRRTYFPTPGALYFQPGAWHGGHPLPPPISDLSDDWPGFWNELARKCRARDIALCAWMPILHNSGTGTAHPRVAVRNPWGDVITHTLCPAHEDVCTLVEHVVSDVANMGIFSRILLESIEYLPLRHGHHHEVIGVPLDADVEFLAALCFCDACMDRMRAAGIKGPATRDWVRGFCDVALTGAARTALSWAELEAGAGGEFGRYLRLREQGTAALMARCNEIIRRADPAIRIAALDFGPLFRMGPNGRRWQNGVDLDAHLPLIDEIHPTYYFIDAAVLQAKITEYASILNRQVPQVPAIRAILPQTAEPGGLSDQVSAVAPHASGYTFYNYSFMSLRTLDWIRVATGTGTQD